MDVLTCGVWVVGGVGEGKYISEHGILEGEGVRRGVLEERLEDQWMEPKEHNHALGIVLGAQKRSRTQNIQEATPTRGSSETTEHFNPAHCLLSIHCVPGTLKAQRHGKNVNPAARVPGFESPLGVMFSL